MNLYRGKVLILFFSLLLLHVTSIRSQSVQFSGQASSWMTITNKSFSDTYTGLRYIPSLEIEKQVRDNLLIDGRLSFNGYGTYYIHSIDNMDKIAGIKPYRMWVRFSTAHFEVRIGLQKISFGSAMLLRPLMWFDRIDPRDPLQITDGVYAALFRYYFFNNVNIWFWGLRGNDAIKGWEFVPSTNHDLEYGGRIQCPLPKGEVGLTFHHRRADLNEGIDNLFSFVDLSASNFSLISKSFNFGTYLENRIGIDGKWDLGPGIWFESVLIHQDIPLFPNKYQKMVTAGLDYTFGIGNGLHAMAEHLYSGFSEKIYDSGESSEFSALSLHYPVDLINSIEGIFYYDWENKAWYRFLRWQRTYNNWSIYVMGYSNPDEFQIFSQAEGNNLFIGTGIQIMAVFNH